MAPLFPTKVRRWERVSITMIEGGKGIFERINDRRTL